MTAGCGAGDVVMRWLPGLGAGCPGAVDLTTTGPLGEMTRAVSLPEALGVALVIDVFCPGSDLHQRVTQLAAERPQQSGHRL